MKNKNLFLVAIFLLSFILNGLTVYANNYRSEASLALKQLDTSKYFIAFKLPVAPHTKKQFQQIIATLNNCAQKMELNYMEKHAYMGHVLRDGKIDYARSFEEQNFYVYKLHQTHFLGNFGALGTDKAEYSYHYPMLKGYQVTIQPLKQVFTSRKNFEGIFFLETLDQEKYVTFLTLLNQDLNLAFKTHYTLNDYQITRQTELLLPSFEIDPSLKPISNYLLIFIVIALLIYFLLEWSQLRLCKLNGWSFSRSFFALASKPLAVLLLSISGDLWALYKKLNLTELLFKQLIGFLIVFCVIYLVMLTMYWVSLNNIKEHYFSTMLFLLLSAVKVLLLTTLISSFAPIGSLLIDGYNTFSHTPTTASHKYAEFFPYVIGNNPVDDESNYEDLKNIYQIADHQGALLLDDSGSSYKQPSTVPSYLVSVTLNINYLNSYPLYDVDHHKIKIDSKIKQTILIFPINKKHLVAKRLEYERKATGASQEYGIKVLYSDPKYNQGFKNIVTGKNIANEILRVITPGNLKAKSSPILNVLSGFSQDALLIPLKGTSLPQLKKKWDLILKKYNLSDNAPQMIRYDQGNIEELRRTLGNILADLLELLVLFLVVLALSFYSLLSFFKKNLTQIELKNTFGYSRLRNYYPYLAMLVFQYIVMLAFYPNQDVSKEVYLVVTSLFFVLEFFILNLFISYLESEAKKNVK